MIKATKCLKTINEETVVNYQSPEKWLYKAASQLVLIVLYISQIRYQRDMDFVEIKKTYDKVMISTK